MKKDVRSVGGMKFGKREDPKKKQRKNLESAHTLSAPIFGLGTIIIVVQCPS